MKKFIFIIIATSSIALYACNNNSTPKTESIDSAKTTNKELKTTDAKTSDFVTNAASGGMMEVEMGKLAEKNALNLRVKNFGSMMVTDHLKANDELKSLAEMKGIALPATIDEKHQKHIDELAKKRGNEFDKAYVDMMLDDHKEDIEIFKKQATDGIDSSFKGFATKTLPVLQKHLDSIKAIAGKL